MILFILLILPFAGGLVSWLTGGWNKSAPRWAALITLVLECALTGYLWTIRPAAADHIAFGSWQKELLWAWVPAFGISFHLALDGMSLLLVSLTAFLGVMAIAVSWNTPTRRPGFYHFLLLWIIAAMIGVFLALDLFLFYVLWELMLVPMYFLIAFWGSGNARAAAIKFFIFTQVSGLLMLIALLALYFANGRATGDYSFDYSRMVLAALPSHTLWWAMAAFFVAFAVKLGIVPFHGWLPDAYAAAPPAGGLLLAGIMSKTGAYGFLRFMVPLFPIESASFSRVMMVLGIITILYGAFVAFAQSDLKRLIAYSSISHMGFALLGIGAWNEPALQGVVVQLLAHGVTIAALFMLAGSLYERIQSSDMDRMGGLWEIAPRMGAVMLLFVLATLGLPGLGTFIGEFLILLGSFYHSPVMAAVATAGTILAVIYALYTMRRVFQGPNQHSWRFADLSRREILTFGLLIVAIVWLGIYPHTFMAESKGSIETLQNLTRPAAPDSTLPALPLYGERP